MKLAQRINKLELSLKNQSPTTPLFDETKYQEFEDWVMNDPIAKELLKKEYAYCRDKGYPQNDPDFYDELDDPLFWDMTRETLAAWDEYLKERAL